MGIEAAKLLGSGIAVIGVIGAGIGIGHIFAAFLALYLSAMLRRQLDELWQREHPDQPSAEPTRPQPAKTRWPWDDLIRDLSQMRGLRVRLDGELYLLRTELKGTADRAFRAVGLRPPPLAQKL